MPLLQMLTFGLPRDTSQNSYNIRYHKFSKLWAKCHVQMLFNAVFIEDNPF